MGQFLLVQLPWISITETFLEVLVLLLLLVGLATLRGQLQGSNTELFQLKVSIDDEKLEQLPWISITETSSAE